MAGADVVSPADFNLEGSRYFFLIDPEFYSAQISGFDSNDKNEVRQHYDNIGWKLGLDSSSLFDTSAYLDANPDIATQNINPLEHYVTKGMAEYRGFGATAGIEEYFFDITSGAPQVEIDLIKDGLKIAQTFADTYLGGGISAEIRKNVTVKIDYTGLGNQEPGGGGSNATGLSVINDLLPRPFFDVGHEQWTNRFTNNGKWSFETAGLLTIVHEYIHGWQNFLGAHTVYQQPLGNWISEGIAEYLAYEAMIKLERIDATDAVHKQISATAFTGEANYALSQIDSSSTPLWVGHIGHVAIDWLMDETGNDLTKLRIIHEKIAEGKNTFTAFSETFGLSLDSFYTQFEQWRPLLLKDPAEALNARSDLILANETSTEGNNTSEIFTKGDTNDTISGAGGDDIINGGAGVDTAKYSGEAKNFTIKINTGAATTVTDIKGVEGTDSLTNIEIVSFSDGLVRVDIDDVAGQAYRIYKAAFARTPDNDGLKFWIGQMDSGVSLNSVAAGFTQSAEFKSVYGTNPTSQVIVQKFYQNVLGRDGEAGGVSFWTGEIDSGKRSIEDVLAGFSESPENITGVAPTIADGIFLV